MPNSIFAGLEFMLCSRELPSSLCPRQESLSSGGNWGRGQAIVAGL